uniref:Arf-GAP domain-containing protein n=1 Tax=Ananas comosus var. bracteatus TaxID=296719 RepID=A0A6V7QQB3_ANACO
MANRMKEDEKNEKIIRGLLKLPANKRCINCNNLGPQYVCANFWTFICTNCSGVHREFTHRVKSVSMAKFTSQEVSALQEGGNECAREIYFKEWDLQRNSYPDSNNMDKLRSFIKHVYVDRRYTGERNVDRPPRSKSERENYDENRRLESYRGGSRSPPYNDRYDRGFRFAYGERSPGYDQSDYRRSPRHFEVVDDRRRDDSSGSGVQNRRFEDRKYPEALKPEGGSPNYQKDVDGSSPPVIRPVRDILGDDAPPLLVGEPHKSNGTKAGDNTPQTQRTSSPSSIESAEGNSTQPKVENSVSLIDFSADPDPPVAAPPPQEQQQAPQQTNSPSTNGGEWAAFDAFGQQKAPQVASSSNPLESALAQLSLPGSTSTVNTSTMPAPVDTAPKTNDGGQLPVTRQSQSSLFPGAVNQPSELFFDAPAAGVPNEQLRSSSVEPSIQGPSLTTAPVPADTVDANASHIAKRPPQETSVISTQPASMGSKSTGRKELPQDFFTSLYPSSAASLPGWQRGPLLGMGYAMQYPTAVAMPTLPQPSKSVNPFDLASEPATIQSPMFPSMTSLQGALPNLPGQQPSVRTSIFEGGSPRWVPPQPLTHQMSYPSAMPPGHYMMHQFPNNTPQQAPNSVMPVLQQGPLGPSNEVNAFGTPGMDQHSTARYSQPSTPNSFSSVGGNPFG